MAYCRKLLRIDYEYRPYVLIYTIVLTRDTKNLYLFVLYDANYKMPFLFNLLHYILRV